MYKQLTQNYDIEKEITRSNGLLRLLGGVIINENVCNVL